MNRAVKNLRAEVDAIRKAHAILTSPEHAGATVVAIHSTGNPDDAKTFLGGLGLYQLVDALLDGGWYDKHPKRAKQDLRDARPVRRTSEQLARIVTTMSGGEHGNRW